MKSDYFGLWKQIVKYKPIYMKENTKKVKKALNKKVESAEREIDTLSIIVDAIQNLDGKQQVNNAMLKNIQDRLEAMQPKKTFWADFGLGVAVGTAITILLYATKII